MKIFHTDVTVSTGNLLKLERCGRYEEALAELRNVWKDTESLPDVDGLPSRIAAEIILRCGAVIGFFGQSNQISNAQEKSKNLIDEARKRFFDLYDVEKIVECENYLALAYLRAGELVEAEIWIDEALSHRINNLSDAWLYSNITKSLIFQLTKKNKEITDLLIPIEDDFLKFGSYFLLGSFYTNLSLAYKNLGETEKALDYLEKARKYHQKSGHKIYLGTVENNLSQFYKNKKRFEEAHQTIDNAIKTFKKLKDRSREGFAMDTKAGIFCDEGKYQDALETIESAIKILSKGENAPFQIETLLSKAKILLHLDNSTAAFLTLSDAVQIAKATDSFERAENVVKEFESALNERNKAVITQTFSETKADETKKETAETLELILHPTIAHYSDFQGVWIKNTHLESYGLKKNSLAVVTKTEVKRGDLVAINEIATDSIMCGFYDSDFGLICLEGIGEEPQLFDATEIEILGKIVGVGRSDNSSNGKIQINPINL